MTDSSNMQKLDAHDPATRSADNISNNIEQLKTLFPDAVTEGSIDFEVLKQLLGGVLDEREEKYGLNWHGKRAARKIALTSSTGTLRPCVEESVDWDSTQNLMIEGDNLEVLKLLQKSYSGTIKLIYIDPPYNTGNDFIYPDDFANSIQNYLAITGQTEDGRKVSSNTDASGRYHTDWLNMMYPRLKLARSLLREDGVICISIDDHEQANLRKICDDIFGEENHVATVVWQKRYVSNVTAKWLSDMHDFVLIYARNKEKVGVKTWERTDEQLSAYKNPDDDRRGVWRAQDLSASKPYSAGLFTIEGPSGGRFDPPPNRFWRCNQAQFEKWVSDGRIWWGVSNDARPMLKSFLAESERGITPHTWWDYEFAGHNKEATLEMKELFGGDSPFDTPKPVRLMRRIIDLFCSGGETVLDFFGGSGSFAHAAMEASNGTEGFNLRFILVQLPEPIEREGFRTIADISKERLRRVASKLKAENPLFASDIGFRVFKLASSNIRAWDPDRNSLEQTLLDNEAHLKADRSEVDVLYELLLKLGLDLCVPIEMRTAAGVDTYSVAGGVLFACLAHSIAGDSVEGLAETLVAWRKALAPAGESICVFRDSAFADDVTKSNLAAILNQNGLTNVRSL